MNPLIVLLVFLSFCAGSAVSAVHDDARVLSIEETREWRLRSCQYRLNIYAAGICYRGCDPRVDLKTFHRCGSEEIKMMLATCPECKNETMQIVKTVDHVSEGVKQMAWNSFLDQYFDC